MGNTVFFRAKKLMERWYLLITEKFLFWPFWRWEIRVFFRAKKLMERWYLLITGKFLFWAFRWWEIRSFFQRKSWWKDDIYLVFLSFLWYSRFWELTMVFRAVYITFKMCWLPYIFLVCYKWNCPAFLCVNVTQIPCVVSRLLLRENFTSFIFCVSCHTFLPDFLCRHSTCHTSFSHFWWMSQVCWYRFLPFM